MLYASKNDVSPTPESTSANQTRRTSSGSALGTASRKLPAHPKDNRDAGFKSESGTPTGAPNTSVGYNEITVDLTPMLTGIGPRADKPIYSLYEDIYYNDPVGGAAVDLLSSLPFSEFTLGGLPDSSVANSYLDQIDRLNTRTLLPELSVDYLVMGAHVSTLLYSTEEKKFKDIMCYDMKQCEIQEVPLYSQDPLITVDFAETARLLERSDSPRIKKIKELMGRKTVETIMKGKVELEPLSTLYIPRRTFSSNQSGTSYYKRILPLYLIEKNLYRGTLMESARRQRGIMHITAGEPDVWDPTEQDLEMLNELFLNADSDPLGAIITTKLGISIEEVRQGGDFWKVTEFQDSVQNAKYHALGISDGLLSGEASYNTADASLSVFIDMLRTYREMITRKVFYNKLFPLVSVLNGYAVNSKGKMVKKDLLKDFDGNSLELTRKFQDGSSLLIPTVNWNKQLKPEGDSAYFEMLNTLTEKGVPVPLRVLAAAGGQNIEDMLRQSADDLDLRKRVAAYAAQIAALAPKAPESEGYDSESSDSDKRSISTDVNRKVLAAVDPTGTVRSAVLAGHMKRAPALLNRNFGDAGEITSTTRTGKKKYVPNQRAANEKVNTLIARSAARIGKSL